MAAHPSCWYHWTPKEIPDTSHFSGAPPTCCVALPVRWAAGLAAAPLAPWAVLPPRCHAALPADGGSVPPRRGTARCRRCDPRATTLHRRRRAKLPGRLTWWVPSAWWRYEVKPKGDEFTFTTWPPSCWTGDTRCAVLTAKALSFRILLVELLQGSLKSWQDLMFSSYEPCGCEHSGRGHALSVNGRHLKDCMSESVLRGSTYSLRLHTYSVPTLQVLIVHVVYSSMLFWCLTLFDGLCSLHALRSAVHRKQASPKRLCPDEDQCFVMKQLLVGGLFCQLKNGVVVNVDIPKRMENLPNVQNHQTICEIQWR